MKILHTSDWHVGKTLRGLSRLEEHKAVLHEICDIARAEEVDVVLVVGDLHESAAPVPDAQAVVLQGLLDLRDTGAAVVVVAGNHDNPHQFEALRPVMQELGITMLGHARRPEDGGVVELTTRSEEGVRLALLPFCSQRYVVRAAQLMAQDAAANAGDYAERMRLMVERLTAGFDDDAVNIVASHCFAQGGTLGGGERPAQTIHAYWVDPTAFPATAHYVALGHLHRMQQLPGNVPVWYCGSPIQVDFGETQDEKQVLLIDASPSTPAVVRGVPVRSGWRLRTIRGSLAELRDLAGSVGDDYLRVFVQEPARVGLADEVREILLRAVDVQIDASTTTDDHDQPQAERRGRTPHELFDEYLKEEGYDDERLLVLFDRLLDEETTAAKNH